MLQDVEKGVVVLVLLWSVNIIGIIYLRFFFILDPLFGIALKQIMFNYGLKVWTQLL